MAEVDLAAGVGVEEDDIVGRAGERGDVREVDLAGGAGPVGPAGAAGLDRRVVAAGGRQGRHGRERDHGAAAGIDVRAADGRGAGGGERRPGTGGGQRRVAADRQRAADLRGARRHGERAASNLQRGVVDHILDRRGAVVDDGQIGRDVDRHVIRRAGDGLRAPVARVLPTLAVTAAGPHVLGQQEALLEHLDVVEAEATRGRGGAETPGVRTTMLGHGERLGDDREENLGKPSCARAASIGLLSQNWWLKGATASCRRCSHDTRVETPDPDLAGHLADHSGRCGRRCCAGQHNPMASAFEAVDHFGEDGPRPAEASRSQESGIIFPHVSSSAPT